MSPHCQFTPPHCQITTPFHPLEWPNTLQTAQNIFFIGWPMPKIYSFYVQIYAPKKKIIQFSLADYFKKPFNCLFFKRGGKF